MQNSHDDGSTAALQTLYMFLVMWEILYHIVRIGLKKLLWRYPNIILIMSDSSNISESRGQGSGMSNSNNNNNSRNGTSSTDKDAKQRTTILLLLQQRGPSYIISFLHSIYVTMRGIIHLYELWHASNFDKLYIPPPKDIVDGYRFAHLHVATTNTLFLSYLLYDLVHIIIQYPKLGGVDTILHHVLFASCSLINGTYGLMAFVFGWLIVGEMSTIFLNIRWFMLKTGHGAGVNNNKLLMNRVNGMFATTFFITRIGIYTAGMIHLFYYSYEELRSLPEETGVPPPLLGVTCSCMVLGWALNMIWGYKILAMVVGSGSGGSGGRSNSNKINKC